MIKIQNNIATREPLPKFLKGLKQESLLDLSWTDPALGVSDSAWYPEQDNSQPLGQFQKYEGETLTIDNENKVVLVEKTIVPWTAEEVEVYHEYVKAKNAEKAKIKQNEVVEEYKTNSAKKALGLPVAEPDPIELENYVKNLEAEILNPSEDPAYQPPLLPGVIPLPITAMFAKVTREVGWNSVLGWKITLDISDPSYIPANIAISVYSAANCTGYLYTPGALQQDPTTGKYFAVCPAGQEQGDVDYHFGLLYGAAQLACWTFPAGRQTQMIQIYGE